MHTAHKATFLQNTQNNTQQFPIILWIMHSQTRLKWGNRFSSLREAFSRELGHDAKQVFVCLSFNGHKNYFLRWGPRGLSFTWWGCCATELAHSFLFCSCVCFCLFYPFNCISFHESSWQLSAFSLCSTGLISALLVLSTILYLFMKVSLSPDIILWSWLGLKHQLTN